MDADLQLVYDQVMLATTPEELFGWKDIVLPPETLLGHLRKQHEPLKRQTDPAQYQHPEDVDAATEAARKLQELYALAELRIRHHVYGMEGRGKPRPVYAGKSFTVGDNRYYVGREIASSERSSTYEGFMERGRDSLGTVMIKVAKAPEFNHFSQNEARVLDVLHDEPVPQWKHLPFLLDRFSAGHRVGIVLRKCSGMTLADVRRHRIHKNGLDYKHMVWMLDRLLSCLGYAHARGLVHGLLTPEHAIVQPLIHNVIITGWSAAAYKPAVSGDKIVLTSKDFSAPEVLRGGAIGPWTDIYSAGQLMIWLLGGNAARSQIPAGIPQPVEDLLRSMVKEDYRARPQDAWQLYDQLSRVRDGLGPRKYLPLDLS